MIIKYAVSKDGSDWYPINFKDDGITALDGESLESKKRALAKIGYTIQEKPPQQLESLSKAENVRAMMSDLLPKDLYGMWVSKVLSSEACLLIMLLRK
jgi:hypothetical protein